MAIDRGPWNALVDDDGSNLTGSIWNKAAIKTVLLDPIDAADATLTPAVATWAPVDASGAGLVFTVTQARYVRIGTFLSVWANLTYPSTANGLAAKIGGLPAPSVVTSGLYVTYGMQNVFHLAVNQSLLQVFHPTTLAPRTNAELSGALIVVAGVYLMA
jgi:hypothetical protein